MLSESLVHVVLLAGLGLLLVCRSPRDTAARIIAIACVEFYVLRYYFWRAAATPPALELSASSLWQWTFFGFESLATLFICWTMFVLTRKSDHRALADAREAQLRARPAPPSVAILIPTLNEPEGVLRRTLAAAALIDYPNKAIFVLDDLKPRRPGVRVPPTMGARFRDWVKARWIEVRRALGWPPRAPRAADDHSWLPGLCAEYGATYVHRPDSDGAKAGNLNFGLKHSKSDVVLVLDADFQALPNILWRLVGLLDERVALVQTPQHYYSADPIQRNLGGLRAWCEEQRHFFDVSLPARCAWGNALCVGTGFVVRRDALGPGGFEVGCLSEDVYGGYALIGRGYRLLYLNEVLSHGAAADSLPEYTKQRVRWAQGIIQAMWLPLGPLRARGLRLLDRLFYLEMPLYWISQYGLLALVLLAPAVYFWTGVPVFESGYDEAQAYLVPRLLVSTCVTHWISRGKVMPIVTDVAKLVGLVYILAGMVSLIVNPKGKPFNPTLKGECRDDVVVNWDMLWPFPLLALVLVGGLARVLVADAGPVAWDEFLAANVALAYYALILLVLASLASVDWPKAAAELDFDQPLEGRLIRTLKALVGPADHWSSAVGRDDADDDGRRRMKRRGRALGV